MAVDRDAARPRGTGSTARSRMCAVASGFRDAVVVEGDALIFIKEEDDQFAGVDDLLDLVLALLVVDGLGHQPGALIHDQGVVVALRGAHETGRTTEEVVVTRSSGVSP